jgi:hypothetical protein
MVPAATLALALALAVGAEEAGPVAALAGPLPLACPPGLENCVGDLLRSSTMGE